MSYTRQIAHNTIIQILGKGLGLVFSVLTIALITRYLGPTGFGYYTTIFAFLQIFGIISDFGLQMITSQIISDPREDESYLLSNIFTIRLFLCSIFFIAPLIGLFFPYPPLIKLGILITSVTYAFTTIGNIFTGLFQKHFLMKKITIADFVNKLSLFLFALIIIKFNAGLLGILLSAAVSNAIFFALTFKFAKEITPIKIVYDKAKWLLIFSRAWPIGLTIFLNLVYFKADTIILSLFREQHEVGLYGAAYRILEVLINFSYLFLGLLLPLLAASFAENNLTKFKNILQRGFEAMVIVAVPLIFGTLATGKKIMELISGQEYASSGEILKILMAATGIIFISAVFGYGIVAINKQKKVIPYYLINAILSLAAYLLFIPSYSFWAAAIITVFSEIFILVISYLILKSQIQFSPDLKIIWKTLIAAGIMYAAITAVSFLPIYVVIAAGILIYFTVLYFLKGFSKDTILEIIRY